MSSGIAEPVSPRKEDSAGVRRRGIVRGSREDGEEMWSCGAEEEGCAVAVEVEVSACGV
jgi:hypothetical protein